MSLKLCLTCRVRLIVARLLSHKCCVKERDYTHKALKTVCSKHSIDVDSYHYIIIIIAILVINIIIMVALAIADEHLIQPEKIRSSVPRTW